MREMPRSGSVTDVTACDIASPGDARSPFFSRMPARSCHRLDCFLDEVELEAVDEVRKWEHGLRHAEGDETLKGTKYLWLFSEENLPEPSRERFAALRALHLKTGRAWAIKESLRDLWAYRRKGWALRHWKRWYFWATHSRLKPVVKVARMIHGHPTMSEAVMEAARAADGWLIHG